ncbi:anti-sigma factor [Flindersiella endophytica]
MSGDLHSLAGPYALDALTDQERARFESHLVVCSACRAEVAEFRATAARMGAAVAQAPPPGLKARVLAEVAQTRQLPPPVPSRAPELRRPRRRQFLLAAAAAGILGAGGVAAWVVRRTSQNRDELLAILAEPDSVTSKSPVSGGGQITVVSSKRKDAAVIILEGVPAPPADRTHQLWLISGKTAASAGTVEVAEDPKDVILDRGVAAADTVGLTIEPTGGSDQPTTDPIAGVPLR